MLSKSPSSILIRCGDSPLINPDGPRESDGLFEMCAGVSLQGGYAEFRLKSVFFSGAAKPEKEGEKERGEKAVAVVEKGKEWANNGPMQEPTFFVHKLYTKMWMESALSRVKK